jgi:nicotinate-nucleotide adenylyltransferase
VNELPPLGLLGGTFDPVHFGHLRLAEEALDRLGLAGVRLIPAGVPPHRERPHAAAAQRLAMAQAAAADNPRLEVDAAEAVSADPSYTVPTLERVRREIGPQRSLVLLLGADAFLGLTAWHRWRELFELAHLAVATRPGHVLDADAMESGLAVQFAVRVRHDVLALRETPAGCIVPFGITALDISATAIRAALHGGASARYLLPAAVLDYISRNRLYAPD